MAEMDSPLCVIYYKWILRFRDGTTCIWQELDLRGWKLREETSTLKVGREFESHQKVIFYRGRNVEYWRKSTVIGEVAHIP